MKVVMEYTDEEKAFLEELDQLLKKHNASIFSSYNYEEEFEDVVATVGASTFEISI